MLLVKSGRQTKISQFDVATFIEENVVWFDVTGRR